MAEVAARQIRVVKWVGFIMLIAFVSLGVDASVHEYVGEKFVARGNAFVLHGGSEGLYASVLRGEGNGSFPATGSGYSSISFETITFRRPKEADASTKEGDTKIIQAVIFEVSDRETIGGSAYGGQRAVCCTPDLANLGACVKGTVIHRPSALNPDWPWVLQVAFKENELAASLPSKTIQIERTGMYNLYFIHCDPSLNGMTMEGKTVWKNPDGYLPGRMSPLLKFYGIMSLFFVILGIFWFSQYVRFWKEILPLQNCISLVIILGALEAATWYFDYTKLNKTGLRSTGITVCAVTVGVVGRTVSRLLILVVSMGFGVVKPTLGGITSRVIMLGVTFFLASEVLELVENVGTISDLSGKARLFLVLPVAILDAFFIVWIFNSLSSTLEKLQARRLTYKLDIYRKFTNALAVTIIISVGWIGYEIYFKSTDVYNERWQSAWVIPAFWHVLSFSLLCIICALWTPSLNTMRYTFSPESGEEFDQEESSLLNLKEAKASSTPDLKTALNADISLPEEDKME